jgi:uncharacterized protein (TIGR02246 family)
MFHLSGRATSRRTGRVSSRRLLPLVGLLIGAGCASAPPADSSPADTITAMLHASADAWNRGDLEAFLDDYLDAPETTFVGTDVVFGVDAIRERYLRSYWSTGRPDGLLRFEDLAVRPLGASHALARGTYVLTDRAGTETGRGMFTLVLVHTDDGWRIIHDHSSSSS